MTKRSRYFLVGSGVILLAGLGGGLFAYRAYQRSEGVTGGGLPNELSYVPADAQMVAYADVHSVMASGMRRELERMTAGRRTQHEMNDFAGVDFEKDVSHVVAFMQADPDGQPGEPNQRPPHVLLLAKGTFDQSRIEQFVKDHGGVLEDYHGKHLFLRHDETPLTTPSPQDPGIRNRAATDLGVGFVRPDLVALGPVALVRQAMDGSGAPSNVTGNAEMMALIRDESSANAWVVGRFDAVSRRMGLPSAVRTQVPALKLVSASAHIDGEVRAKLKAQAADAAAADQLRDVVHGAISFARLQAGSKPELENALKTVELGGTGTSVQLSFVVTPDMLRVLAPRPPSSRPPPPRP